MIAAVGGVADAAEGAEVLDARGCVVTPGLVNTHHHLYQALTRAVPAGQDALLFGWLKTLYPIWARMEPEDMFVSAQLGLAELALSGCTMSSDHLYLFPNGVRLEDTIEAAGTVGIRFHPTRGAMSVGESAGGLPPDSLVEDEPAILDDMVRVVDAFHDPAPAAMVRVGPRALLALLGLDRADGATPPRLARDKGVMLHTHLAENDEDIAYSLAQFGCRPGQYAEDLGWTGDHVWHAHCVKLDAAEIDLFARSRHRRRALPLLELPARLGDRAGARRCATPASASALGVDGSASNDAGHLLSEARQAMLLQRVRERRRRDERPRGAGDRHPRRRRGARPRRRARLDRARQARRPRDLGRLRPRRRRRLGPGGGARALRAVPGARPHRRGAAGGARGAARGRRDRAPCSKPRGDGWRG